MFAANLALDAERAKTEELLYNVLPQEVAARLKAGEAVADAFSDVTVVFVDLVGFSRLAKRLSPGHLVQLLNAYFSAADRCCERHGLEKVKTIGDAYLAVAGGMASRGADARAAIAFARDLIAELKALQRRERHRAAGAGRHPCRAGGRRRDRQPAARLRLLGRHDERRQPAARRRAAERRSPSPRRPISRSRGSLPFEPQTLILKGIGETEVYIASLDERLAGARRAGRS